MYKMNKVRELKIDNTLWATPARIINLLDFNPEKSTIDNTPDIHQVRYHNGGFYLTIDNIKGYFKLDDNISGILDILELMIKKIIIIKYGKKFLNLLIMKMEN